MWVDMGEVGGEGRGGEGRGRGGEGRGGEGEGERKGGGEEGRGGEGRGGEGGGEGVAVTHTCEGEVMLGSAKLVWELEVLMSAGFLLLCILEFRVGLGRVEEREVLLLRINRLSRENMSSGSFSLTMARSPAISGDGSFIFLSGTGHQETKAMIEGCTNK